MSDTELERQLSGDVDLANRILRVTSRVSLEHYGQPAVLWDLDACLRDKAKLRRAYGECLGNQKR